MKTAPPPLKREHECESLNRWTSVRLADSEVAKLDDLVEHYNVLARETLIVKPKITRSDVVRQLIAVAHEKMIDEQIGG